MGKPRNLFESYVKALTKKLGPHYRYEHYGSAWLGFIYCECYYGEGFFAWPPSWSKTAQKKNKVEITPNPPLLIPGAVARVEKTRVVVLDLTQDHKKDGSPKYFKKSNSDAIFINAADPTFNEEFMKMTLMHKKNMEYFGVKNVSGRSDSVR